MTGYLRGEVRLPGNLGSSGSARPRVSITWNTEFLTIILFMFFSHTHGAPRDHRPVDGDQYSRHGRGFITSDGGNNSTQHHDTSAHHEEDPWCVRRMWVPPAQEYQGEEFGVALLTGCKQTNLCDEVNLVNRYVMALKIGVPPPPVARDLELDANVRNVGKLRKRHFLPVSRARQRISPFLFHSLFGV